MWVSLMHERRGSGTGLLNMMRLKPECPIYFSTVGDKREGKHQCLGGFFFSSFKQETEKEPGQEPYNCKNAPRDTGPSILEDLTAIDFRLT